MITIKHKYTNEVILEIESLCNANLSNAGLRNATLKGTNLRGANLSGTDLSEANLSDTDLRNATLKGTNLRYANLRYANLRGANLSGTDLSEANLKGTNLSGANLSGTDLRWCIGNMREIKSAQFDTYEVTWSKDSLAIGYQQHLIKEWWQFDDATIAKMGGDMQLWWKKWKLVLQQIIEMSA